MSQEAFKPDGLGASVIIAATTTASATAIPNTSGAQLYVSNEGASAIRVGFGISSSAPASVSSSSGISIPSGVTRCFTLDQIFLNQQAYFYVATATATATVGICRGNDGH